MVIPGLCLLPVKLLWSVVHVDRETARDWSFWHRNTDAPKAAVKAWSYIFIQVHGQNRVIISPVRCFVIDVTYMTKVPDLYRIHLRLCFVTWSVTELRRLVCVCVCVVVASKRAFSACQKYCAARPFLQTRDSLAICGLEGLYIYIHTQKKPCRSWTCIHVDAGLWCWSNCVHFSRRCRPCCVETVKSVCGEGAAGSTLLNYKGLGRCCGGGGGSRPRLDFFFAVTASVWEMLLFTAPG